MPDADVEVAVAHYPEGAGHATRMLAVARALEARGARAHLAGGGPGARFAELNGFEEFEPRRVDYIGDYQDGGSLLDVLANSVPASAARVRDYVRWLRALDPAAVVADDMFATLAAPLAGVPLYVLTHNAPFLYDGSVERTATAGWTAYQRAVARDFLYPAVWPPVAGDPAGLTRIPPVALDADEGGGALDADEGDGADGAPVPDGEGGDPDPDEVGVLVVPSHYSPDPGALADRIAGAGHAVTEVGGEDWEPVASLLPTVRAATAVVCSGYSTVMEAAVAGTPCVVWPHTDEQRGVARVLSATGTPGVVAVDSPRGALAALEDPPAAPARENGADRAARRVLSDLQTA